MKGGITLATLLTLLFISFSPAHSTIINGDFASFDGWQSDNGYWPIPTENSTNFSLSGDGSATLQTDDINWQILLSQQIAIPVGATTISFDFDDSFGFFSQATLDSYDLLTNGTFEAGRYTADISSFVGSSALLLFGVADYYDDGFDESLTIGNIKIATAPVPEPSTLLLMAVGLSGLGLYNYRRKHNQK